MVNVWDEKSVTLSFAVIGKFENLGNLILDFASTLPNSVWPDSAKFCQFGNDFKSFRHLFEGLFSLGQNFETSYANIFVIGIIFIVVIEQIM